MLGELHVIFKKSMKRNLDLIRKLLLYLEEKPDDKVVWEIEFEDYSKSEVMYHFILMDQAGFLRCERTVSSSTDDRVIKVYPFSLTWEGHEFLEASRNETRWNEAKRIVKEKTGSLSFALLKTILISLSKKSLGI